MGHWISRLAVSRARPALRKFGGCLAALAISAAVHAQTLEIGKGTVQGYFNEAAERVMHEAARRAGVTLNFQQIPLARSASMANQGAIDGELLRTAGVTADYPNLVIVPTPIATSRIALYGHEAVVKGKSLEELKKMRIGIVKNVLLMQKSTAGLDVMEGPTPEKVLEMLRNRRFDVALLPCALAEAALKKEGPGDIVRWPGLWASEPMYFVLNKSHAALIPRINGALVAMQKEGLIDRYGNEVLQRESIAPVK
jgi:polar amino acid transport system substrate-binding protein